MTETWTNMGTPQLQQLYATQSRQLEHRLLHGASWQEVHQQRLEITAMALAIYHRLNPPSQKKSRSRKALQQPI